MVFKKKKKAVPQRTSNITIYVIKSLERKEKLMIKMGDGTCRLYERVVCLELASVEPQVYTSSSYKSCSSICFQVFEAVISKYYLNVH